MAPDDLLDRILTAWSRGEDPGLATWCGDDPARRARADAALAMAREVAVVRPVVLPVVSGYRLVREIGRGGMGVVYLAQQLTLHRPVALKVLPDAVLASDRARRRFLAEARSLGRLRHPHVVTVYEAVEAEGLCAFAMEWIDGKSLEQVLAELTTWPRRGPAPSVTLGSTALPADPTVFFCRVGIAVARALGEVHRHDLVHRDVKPANVLLRCDGTPLLSDFGLARDAELGLTHSGQFVGTLAFAAPEQLRGEAAGPSVDVFGLGATLHAALSGQTPFAGRSPLELLRAVEAGERLPLTQFGLSRDLDTIVGKCLAAAPAERYATADAVADDLENLLALRPITARRTGVIGRGMRFVRRNRRSVAAASLGAVLALLVAIAGSLAAWRSWTLEDRVAASLRAARFELLEPLHTALVEVADHGAELERDTRFASGAASALAGYDRTLDLAPDRESVLLEREVVALAQACRGGGVVAPSAELRARCPRTAAVVVSVGFAVQVAAQDPFDSWLEGLFAFLLARAAECHAAWRGLDLQIPGDPFVDAAAGQMHLARGDHDKAWPRLVRALDAWPQAGFLAVAVADCALQRDDPDAAATALARGEAAQLRDPYRTHLRVRGDLYAARGEFEQAAACWQAVLAKNAGATARRHYAEMLAARGDVGAALELYLEMLGGPNEALAWTPFALGLAERWWRDGSLAQRVAAVVDALGRKQPDDSRIERVAVLLARMSGTLATATSSATGIRAFKSGSFTMELLHMKRERNDLSERLSLRSKQVLAGACVYLDALDSLDAVHRLTACLPRGSVVAVLLGCLPLAAAAQTQWTQKPVGTSPSGRQIAAAGYDAQRLEVVMFGGTVNQGGTEAAASDTWRWSGAGWTQAVSGGTPPARVGATLTGTANGLILFGGHDLNSPRSTFGDTWRWGGLTWTQLSPPTSPPARTLHCAAYDSARGVVVVFGGRAANDTILRDTWEWNGTTWTDRTPGLPVSPSARVGAGVAYDSVRGRIVLFGAYEYTPAGGRYHLNDTWEYDGIQWTPANPAASPGARGYAGMAFDSERCVTVVHGGSGTGFVRLSDTWEWNGAQWAQRVSGGASPSARTGAAFVFDPGHGECVMFGGRTAPTALAADTWTYGAVTRATYTVFGAGCPGTGGTPALAAAPCSLPQIGSPFEVRLSNLPTGPTKVTFFILGFSLLVPPIPVLPGCFVFVSPTPPALIYPLFASSGGTANWSFTIPNSSNIQGLPIHNQALGIDLVTGVFDGVSNAGTGVIGTR